MGRQIPEGAILNAMSCLPTPWLRQTTLPADPPAAVRAAGFDDQLPSLPAEPFPNP